MLCPGRCMIHLMLRAALTTLLFVSLLPISAAAAPTRFRFPAEDPNGDLFMAVPVVGVDHDNKTDSTGTLCTNYKGDNLPWCYDGHDGTDYLLIWGFATMDAHDVKVVAGAAGEVTRAVDGNYDRCHETSGFKVTCDGHEMKANMVTVRHADGIQSSYVHLKKGSVQVKVGQQVACGELLGYVGSSGKSARPHLHFEVKSAAGATIDPYAGKNSQPTSYWTAQQGNNGMPGTLCQGQKPPDAGPGDGAGPAADFGTPGPPDLPIGCNLPAPHEGGSQPILLLLLGLIVYLRVR